MIFLGRMFVWMILYAFAHFVCYVIALSDLASKAAFSVAFAFMTNAFAWLALALMIEWRLI